MHRVRMTVVKRSRDAQRSREAILDAAERLFAERGYEATSFQLVGDAAGVSRGTPGYFFGSKEGLYRAVFNRAFTRVDAILHDAYAEVDGLEAREAIARIVSGYLSIPHQIVRLGDREALRGGKTIQDIEPRLSQLRSSLDRLEALTGRRLKEVPARILLICIVALAWYPVSHSATMLSALNLDIDDPAFRAEYTNFVTDLLLHGLARD
jgi:TetR/AcrR family transcriptional regulator